MDLALAIAKSGLEAQHQNIEIISNNLANASTVAFKRSRASFEDLPYTIERQPGSPTSQETDTPTGLVMGTGTKLVGNSKIYTDGTPYETHKATDLAITGRGFFQVELPNGGGFAYTRSGNFEQNSNGELVTHEGYVLQPPITIPIGTKGIQVSGDDGIITATLPGAATPTQLGQLQLADFINPDSLQPVGGNLYLQTISSGTATLSNPGINGFGVLTQGSLEASNVNVVEEMVNLIEAQRAFEVTSKAVSTVDSMMSYLEQHT